MALRLHCNTTTTNSTLLSTDSSHWSLTSNSPHSELIRSYLNYDGRLGVLVVDLQANAGPPLLGVFEFKKLIGPNGVVPTRKSFRVTVACCMRGDFGDSGGLYKAVGGYRTSYGTQISMARDAIQRRQGHKKFRVSPIRNNCYSPNKCASIYGFGANHCSRRTSRELIHLPCLVPKK